MNSLIEEEIVKSFVVTNRQERILWELNNQKKRSSIFWRFSGSQIFNSKCLQPIAYMSIDEMETFFLRRFNVKNVYFIGESHIGQLPLKEALKKVTAGEICILYCGNGRGYYQGEQEFGSTPRFLLKTVEKTD